MSLPTDNVSQGEIQYGNKTARPLHYSVRVKLRKPGLKVACPEGQAIGCSKNNPCDIRWKVDLQNSTCPCAFNNSCCRGGVSFSFWWWWSDEVVSWYRHFLDFGGIYVFYNAIGNPVLKSRFLDGADSNQWYKENALPHNTWNHLAFTMKSSQMIAYLNGRCVGKSRSRILPLYWFPDSSAMHPRLWLKQTDGAYSFGNFQLWEGQKSAAFVWRQYYEKVLIANEP